MIQYEGCAMMCMLMICMMQMKLMLFIIRLLMMTDDHCDEGDCDCCVGSVGDVD